MHKQRLVVMICALLGMLGTFLPWVEIPVFGGAAGTNLDGWWTLGLYAVAATVALKGPSHDDITGGAFLCAALPALVASGIGIWDIVEIKSALSGAGAGADPFAAGFGSMISIGIGLYMVAGSGVVISVAGKLMMEPSTEGRVQIRFDSQPESTSRPVMRADATMPERDKVGAGRSTDRAGP